MYIVYVMNIRMYSLNNYLCMYVCMYVFRHVLKGRTQEKAIEWITLLEQYKQAIGIVKG